MARCITPIIEGDRAERLAAAASILSTRPEDLIGRIIDEWLGVRAGLLVTMSPRRLELAAARLDILQRWLATDRREGLDGISRSTLYKWDARYCLGGLAGLLDQRRGGVPRHDGKVIEAVRRELVKRPQSIAAAYRAATGGRSARTSYKTVQRAFAGALNRVRKSPLGGERQLSQSRAKTRLAS